MSNAQLHQEIILRRWSLVVGTCLEVGDGGRKVKEGRHPAAKRLSHLDASGRARMVDVTDKPVTLREAVARGHIAMSPEALAQVRSRRTKKGDPLETARLAGIM